MVNILHVSFYMPQVQKVREIKRGFERRSTVVCSRIVDGSLITLVLVFYPKRIGINTFKCIEQNLLPINTEFKIVCNN